MQTSRHLFSASVDLRMFVEGKCYELCQAGPMFAILKQAANIPSATEATIEVIVDNLTTSKRTVFLYDGANEDSDRIDFF